MSLRSVVGVLILLLAGPVQPSPGQSSGEKDLLLFGKGWLSASDYAWSRESVTRLKDDSEPGARVKDYGRLRVRFIDLEEDLLGLKIQVLRYRYEAQLRGKKPFQGKSELEGEELPPVWLHPALGFSVDSDPRSGFRMNIQAGEIFDLLDFRGFVPREIPEAGERWNGRMVREPDDRFRFREERDRSFTCRSVEKGDHGDRFEIDFHETLKVTSLEPSRSHEIRETDGTYWITLPLGRVESASWEWVSTEYRSGPGSGGMSNAIETRTRVHLVRRDPPPPRRRNAKSAKSGEAVSEKPPLPPR